MTSSMKRTKWFNPNIDTYEDGLGHHEVMVPCDPPIKGLRGVQPNLISSKVHYDGAYVNMHMPVLDVDFPARLLPSTTPGHHHLYLDGLLMDWPAYAELLKALAKAEVIEKGYLDASLRRGMTCVRPPGVHRPLRP